MFVVELRPVAARSLHRLLRPSVAGAVIELLSGPLSADPYAIGKPLRGAFEGLRVVRRGEYRVIYLIDGKRRRVDVLRIEHRRDAYRRMDGD